VLDAFDYGNWINLEHSLDNILSNLQKGGYAKTASSAHDAKGSAALSPNKITFLNALSNLYDGLSAYAANKTTKNLNA